MMSQDDSTGFGGTPSSDCSVGQGYKSTSSSNSMNSFTNLFSTSYTYYGNLKSVETHWRIMKDDDVLPRFSINGK